MKKAFLIFVAVLGLIAIYGNKSNAKGSADCHYIYKPGECLSGGEGCGVGKEY